MSFGTIYVPRRLFFVYCSMTSTGRGQKEVASQDLGGLAPEDMDKPD
jgi:hypothetical protein